MLNPEAPLFRERPPAELALLFERLGFRLLAREVAADGLDRADIRWTTLVFRLDAATGTRPVDEIETIINRDRKTATYKLALLRALCDVAQTAHHHVRWHGNDTVSVPLGLVAEHWLYYFWPLIDADITQIRGQGKNKPEAFRAAMDELISEFRNIGGLDAFHTAYRNNQLTRSQCQLADSALNRIANTIVVGPVAFAGGALDGADSFFTHSGHKRASGKCFSTQGLLENLGQIHFRAEIWRELCLVGHWIGEAILLRWAELTHEFTKQSIPLAVILEKLLIRPESQRDVAMMRRLYASFERLECVWTGRTLQGTGTDGAGFVVDHVIPFVLWHNNDLWNLLPADANVNRQKSDRIVTRQTLRASEERIIRYWQETRRRETFRFDSEISRALLGRNHAETQWEKPAFVALQDATEMVAIQRGVERWELGMTSRAGRRARSVADSTATAAASVSTATPSRAEGLVLVPFADLEKGEPFRTALPLVASLAAGSLTAGFEAGTLDAWAEFNWLRVPAEFARQRRFVVRLTGDSMEPTLHKGDLVVFEYHRTPRQDGDVVIVGDFSAAEATGECAVKRFRTDPADWLFTSDNRAYPEIRSTRAAQDYPILGVMVARLSADA